MKTKHNQKGNVLFLILIAVALFAALSYAVTQSSRSGGDASRETNVLNSAALTQYPASIRTAVMRLTIDGIQDVQLLFSRPENFIPDGQSGYDADYEAQLTREIFHPLGGAAIYQLAPSETVNPGVNGQWFFNMDFEIPGIGMSRQNSVAGNDLIGFLPGVTDSVCRRINMEAGITNNLMANIPVAATGLISSTANPTTAGFINRNMSRNQSNADTSVDYTLPTTEVVLNANLTVGTTVTNGVLSGRPFGCFDTSGTLVFYSVIMER